MLKKVLCILLILTCSMAIFACGDNSTASVNPPAENQPEVPEQNPETETENGEVADKEFVNDQTEVNNAKEQTFFSVVNNSKPNKIVTVAQTTHSVLGTCEGRYETVIYGDGDYSFYYRYQKFNKIGEGDKLIEDIGPGMIYYHDGQYFLDEEKTVYANPDPAVLDVKLELNKNSLGNFVISADGTQLTTKISAADAKKVLGVDIDATSNVEITVKTDGTHLWNVSVDYSNGETKLHIETSYTYEIVSNNAK